MLSLPINFSWESHASARMFRRVIPSLGETQRKRCFTPVFCEAGHGITPVEPAHEVTAHGNGILFHIN